MATEKHSQEALQEKYCSGISNNQDINERFDNGIVLPMLMKAALNTCPHIITEKREQASADAGAVENTTEEPDDSLLYAVVIGLLYVFIMVFLIFANIHPSRSLLADLRNHDGLTDVNLNEDLPFELAQLMKLEMKHGSNMNFRDWKNSDLSSTVQSNPFSRQNHNSQEAFQHYSQLINR